MAQEQLYCRQLIEDQLDTIERLEASLKSQQDSYHRLRRDLGRTRQWGEALLAANAKLKAALAAATGEPTNTPPQGQTNQAGPPANMPSNSVDTQPMAPGDTDEDDDMPF